MASAGTLLSDLDSTGGGGGGGGNDGDFVQKILQDMNIPTAAGQQAASRPMPPPLPAQTPSYPPQAMSTQGITMDSRIPAAHVIGNEHPTPADFAAAMVGATGRLPAATMQGAPYIPGSPVAMQAAEYEPPQKNWYGRIAEEIKVPFIVALLFFVFSLSPIRVLVAHYVPAMMKNTGDYQVTGLLAVSAIVGLTFWILHRVVAPLLSI
jgi:hypothetical protein